MPHFLQEPKPVDLYFRVVMITISLVELARFLDLIWTLCPEPLGAARERSHAADELFSTLRTALDHL
jgi:hypothetical protein